MNNKKGFTLVEIMIVVVIILLLAAMALPAFQKARANSQMSAMVNNLRMIAAGADQYFLETGLETVAVADLIGNDLWVKDLKLVANETYPTNVSTTTDELVVTGPPAAALAAFQTKYPTATAISIAF